MISILTRWYLTVKGGDPLPGAVHGDDKPIGKEVNHKKVKKNKEKNTNERFKFNLIVVFHFFTPQT
jgi:hypothetical protein